MYKKIFFIGGLPRTGSTLLSSILSQNNLIHIEGKSALCQIVWDAHKSVEYSNDFLIENDKDNFKVDYIEAIPKIYYKNVKRDIIFDKNPFWTNSGNLEMIEKYIDPNFKMIVMYRNIEEIFKSISYIHQKNNLRFEKTIVDTFPEIIINIEDFLKVVKEKNQNKYLFIDYDSILLDVENVLRKIYTFFNFKNFNHDLSNIQRYPKQSDNFYKINDLYEVRKNISKRDIDFLLDKKTIDICNYYNEKINEYKMEGLC